MVATELVKPIMIAFVVGLITGIMLTILVAYNIIRAVWDKLTGIFRKKIKESDY